MTQPVEAIRSENSGFADLIDLESNPQIKRLIDLFETKTNAFNLLSFESTQSLEKQICETIFELAKEVGVIVKAIRDNDLVQQESKMVEAKVGDTAKDVLDRQQVTNADNIANKLIVDRLQALYPNIAIASEEQMVDVDSDSEYSFIVDPIDGTSLFVNGENGYSIVIGLYKNNELVTGIVHLPETNTNLGLSADAIVEFEKGSFVNTSTYSDKDNSGAIIVNSRSDDYYRLLKINTAAEKSFINRANGAFLRFIEDHRITHYIVRDKNSHDLIALQILARDPKYKLEVFVGVNGNVDYCLSKTEYKK
jgi:fructose-1,6-bisphosphatase/inositol monophosphatase family enzyme